MPRNFAENETQMNFRIDKDKKKAFYEKVKADGANASQILLKFIDEYLGVSPINYEEIDGLKQKIADLEDFRDRTEKILGELAA
jgi:hypothetical protein